MKAELSKPEDVEGGYSYTYGLVSGLHSKFLGKKEFEVLALSVNVDEVLASLEKTDYNPEIEKIQQSFTDADLERAMNKNFMRVYREVLDSMPERDQSMFGEIVLGEADLSNLKTIMRGLHGSLAPAKIKLMIRPGSIEQAVISRLADSASMEDFLEAFLDVGYFEENQLNAIKKSAEEYKKTGKTAAIEMAVDNAMAGRWLSNTLLGDYVRMKVDALNIVNLFRCRMSGIKFGRHMLEPGMHLQKHFLNILETLPVNEILSSLANTPYGQTLSKNISPGRVDLLKMERVLDEFILEDVKYRAMLDPISVWSVLAFMKQKEREVRNVRIILTLKSHNYPSEKIRNALI